MDLTIVVNDTQLWIGQHPRSSYRVRHDDHDAVLWPIFGNPRLQDWRRQSGARESLPCNMSDPNDSAPLVIIDAPIYFRH
jgi:hypothetical protein